MLNSKQATSQILSTNHSSTREKCVGGWVGKSGGKQTILLKKTKTKKQHTHTQIEKGK